MPYISDVRSCGEGSLGEPPRQGDGQCGNMRLLLRQQQRVRNSKSQQLQSLGNNSRIVILTYIMYYFLNFQILLAKSDVAGWGAFLKVRR